MTFSTENPLKNWSKQQQPPLYLQNSKRAFLSAGSCFQYSQLQLDKFSQPEINFFLQLKHFHCGSPMDSQDDLVHMPYAMKQHNMHNSCT